MTDDVSSAAQTDVRIRRLGPGDAGLYDAMLDLFGAAFGDPQQYGGARPNPIWRDRLLTSETFVALVACQDEMAVGALAAYELQKFEQERSEIYIYELAVAEAHRRQGIATRLIEALRSMARERGAWVIFVQADLGDEPAIALYQALGAREEVLHFDIAVDARTS